MRAAMRKGRDGLKRFFMLDPRCCLSTLPQTLSRTLSKIAGRFDKVKDKVSEWVEGRSSSNSLPQHLDALGDRDVRILFSFEFNATLAGISSVEKDFGDARVI